MIQDKKTFLINLLQHVAVVAFFLLATIIYFSPEFFDNKALPQHDVSQFEGSSQDIRKYYNQEGESSAWTGGMFSGMPSYQIGVWGGSPNILDYIEKPLKALGGTTAGPVFAGMLMAYILFLVMGCRIPLAMFGAIAYSLSSYNIIILEAGHVTKAWTLAYMPIVIAGMLSMYKNKYLVGGLCMALGLALQIKSNHLQITYYTGILCVILYIGLVAKQIKNKEFVPLLKSSAMLAIAVVLALLSNAGNLYSNYEMSLTSTRGKSELTSKTDTNTPSDGLGKDDVFRWSYGKAETLSLLIPNIHGGGSVTWLDASSALQKEMKANGFAAQIDRKQGVQGYTYWGDQPGTSGPIYVGAIVCFLFLLGMFIIRNPMKWVLLASTIFFILLAWGKNFDAFNDIFYNYFPLYTKFRAVSQALVIPALTMVIVAVWTIKVFFDGAVAKEKLTKSLYISGGIIAGICLFFWIMPDFFFNFTSLQDMAWKSQMPDWFYKATLLDRKSMLSSDAFRSFAFVAIAAGAMWLAINKVKTKNAGLYVTILLVVLTFADLWTVDKRYLNDNKFVKKEQQQLRTKSAADEIILQDNDNFRVLTLNNPFAETSTSYYHRSIGGYHAAKLQRYQQLIEHRLNGELQNIQSSFATQDINQIVAAFEQNTALNMLNTRYMIFDPSQQPLANPYALGNTWFVNSYKFAENADAEIEALDTLDAKKEAVIDQRYQSQLGNLNIKADSAASIELVAYKPDVLTYNTKASTEQLVVFSEIYYQNGWNAYVDGKLTPHFCANWTLRSMIVPAGEHEIVFKFEPTAYHTSRTMATVSSGLLVLLLLGTIGFRLGRGKETKIDKK